MKRILFQHGWWIWWIIILVLTSIPGQELPDVEITNLDKLVHFTIYFILGMLVQVRFIGLSGNRSVTLRIILILCGVLFAAIDELHQHLIPGRTASWADFFFDSIGMMIAFLVYHQLQKVTNFGG
jgi:VanZ family protein